LLVWARAADGAMTTPRLAATSTAPTRRFRSRVLVEVDPVIDQWPSSVAAGFHYESGPDAGEPTDGR
jgi:hypothetical protein